MNKETIIILLYITGCVVSYIIFRIINNTRDWAVIGISAMMSILSWFMVICIIFAMLFMRVVIFFEDYKPKPPKWL